MKSEDGYVWWVCEVCGRDKFGMRRGETLNVKFRERQITIVGGKVSMLCTWCGTICTADLTEPDGAGKPLLGA